MSIFMWSHFALTNISYFAWCSSIVVCCVCIFTSLCKKYYRIPKMSTIHIKDKEDFDSKLQDAGDQLVVVDFFATWCGPCKMIAPKLEELAKEHANSVLILKVDVDECEEIAVEYNIMSMPTFVFIKNKAVVTTFSGANYEKLVQTIASNK